MTNTLFVCACMHVQHMEYRKKYGADTILHDYTPPELFTECLAGGFFGEDLQGHPVWYDNLGNMDFRGETMHFHAYMHD